MAIAVSTPDYETVSAVARRYGVDPSAVVRWLQRGTRVSGGRIRPEGVIRTPGKWLIPVGAIEAWLERVTAAQQGVPAPTPQPDRARERQIAAAEARLTAAGI
jgi:transposase-like protein